MEKTPVKDADDAVKEEQAAGSNHQPGPPKKPARSESRFRVFLRKLAIWFLIVLVSFLAGITVLYAFVHRPILAELDQAKADIQSLQAQVDTLAPLEGQNKALQTEVDEANTHATLLSVESDVFEARMSLVAEDTPAAHVALSKTEQTLNELKEQLPATHAPKIDDMLVRYQLVMSEIDRDQAAAGQDLEMLSSQLMALENAMYTNP